MFPLKRLCRISDQIQLADYHSYRYPVSIKGVVVVDKKVPLLKNDRHEWELPGGKLDLEEQPHDCIVREIKEELNIDVKVKKLLDAWLYHIDPKNHVVIITYACSLCESNPQFKFSSEHSDLMLCDLAEIDAVHMPVGYKKSIKTWAEIML